MRTELKKRSVRNRRRGFTLMEVMLVLVILAIIAGMGVMQLLNMQKQAYMKAAETKIKALDEPLKMYAMNIGSYPETEDGLMALLESPSSLDNPDAWAGPYIEDEVGNDPWGMLYQYEYPGTNSGGDKYDLWSMGPDKVSGTDDDITNWGT